MGELFEATLPRAEWAARRDAYRARVRPWADDRLRRNGRREKHPVYDFLFEYYFYRPSYLLRWSPGAAVRLADAGDGEADWPGWFAPCPGGRVVPAASFPARRREYLAWAVRYLEATGAREPQFGCFGLHEWAMVYRDDRVRHGQVPLRLARADTDAVVEGGVRCSHYDAFRFFTPAAVPLNRVPLTCDVTTDQDQPGCVHVNMDLYKFAFVLAPWSAAEVVADAFELALAARELDMRASPYDLSGYGFAPIPIETRDGREEYVALQKEIHRRGVPVRARVLGEYRRLVRLLAADGQLLDTPRENSPAAST